MKLSTIIGIVMIILFFGLPILTGFTILPEDMRPNEIGGFLGGIFMYWIEVVKAILKALGLVSLLIFVHSP